MALLNPEIQINLPNLGWIIAAIMGIGITVRGLFRLATKTFVRFRHLDKEKEEINNNYVRKDLCEERSGNIEEKLNEIIKDVKTLLRLNGQK